MIKITLCYFLHFLTGAQGFVDDISLIKETQTSSEIDSMFSTETSILIGINSAINNSIQNTHLSIYPTSSSQLTSSVSVETIITQFNKVTQITNQLDIFNSSSISIFHTEDFLVPSSSDTVGTTSINSLHLIQFTPLKFTSISLSLSKEMILINSMNSDLTDSFSYTTYLRVTSTNNNHFTEEQLNTPGFSSADYTFIDSTQYAISKAHASVALSSKDSVTYSNIGLLKTVIQNGHTISILSVLSTITPSISNAAKTPLISVSYKTDLDKVNSTNNQMNTSVLESYSDILIFSTYYQTTMSDQVLISMSDQNLTSMSHQNLTSMSHQVLTSTTGEKSTTYSMYVFNITTSSEFYIDEQSSYSHASSTSLVGTCPLTEQ